MTIPMCVVFLGVLAVIAHAADRAPADRYRRIEDHADLGEGADEYGGPRKFTRPSEAADTRKAPDLYRQAPSGAFATHQIPDQETR